MSATITARCSECHGTEEIRVFSSINVAENPELKNKVRDGSLFVWQCPHCGKLNLALYQTLYHDSERKLMILLMPTDGMTQEQKEAVEANISAISAQLGQLDDYTLRRVDDSGSLIEKVNIAEAGLEDTVIEMCKYITKMELVEKETSKERIDAILDAPFKFWKLGGADNEITFSFPLDGSMQSLNIGFNVYEDCAGIIRRNPSVKTDPGLVRIDAAWVSKFFR